MLEKYFSIWIPTMSNDQQSVLHCKVSVKWVVAHWWPFCIIMPGAWFLWRFFFIINFQKEKANALTILIILIAQSLQIKLYSTNLLLRPQICWNKHAIIPKCYNSLEARNAFWKAFFTTIWFKDQINFAGSFFETTFFILSKVTA